MNALRQQRTMAVVVAVIAAAALAACSSTPASSTAVSAQASVGAGGSPGSASVASSAASAAPSAGSVAVDLVFTGTKAFVAKGSAGRCIVVKRSDGTFSFGFEATEADYPGLGTDYSMANLSGTSVDIKWAVDATTAYFNAAETSIVLSADHHSVRIDGDLAPGQVAGGPPAGPEHLSGTISCP
jgi:hypothetical protein